MAVITVTEKDKNEENIDYIEDSLFELFKGARCETQKKLSGSRTVFEITCPETYEDIVRTEVADRAAEIVSINYKYDFLKSRIYAAGLSSEEKEILLASLIAADLDDDKKFAFDKLKNAKEMAVDGIYNFRMQALKRKWSDVASYIPMSFLSSQLKDFIFYLLESKKKRVYVDGEKVYDCHYKRLKRSELLGGENLKIIKEVLLSNCGEVEIAGEIPKADEEYLKEFFKGRIIFSSGYFS